MQLLYCETCNTLHRKWLMFMPITRSITDAGHSVDRKRKNDVVHYCPLDNTHKVRLVIIAIKFNDAEVRKKLFERFKPLPKGYYSKHKDTCYKNALFMSLGELAATDLLEVRKLIT